MDSLKIKFVGLSCVILAVTVGLTTWYNLQAQEDMLNRLAAEHGRVLAGTVSDSLLADMASGRSDRVGHILAEIGSDPAIEHVRIFDESGRILAAANPAEKGRQVPAAALAAYRNGAFSNVTSRGDHAYFNSIAPIGNQPLCHGCHEPGAKVLGVLDVQMSLDALADMQTSGRHATLITSGTMLAILLLTLTGLMIVYVDRPIRTLIGAMDQVEQGHFGAARTTINNTREMAHLATKFNVMVERVRQLMEDTVKHERELATTQEKLAYSEKLEEMKMSLQERLLEIEYLNINLEERIEEIEEANYRIADLASELDEKNVGLTRAVERLQALNKVGLAINATIDIDPLLDLLSSKSRETLKAEVGYILLLDEKTGHLTIGGASGLSDKLDHSKGIALQPGGVSYWVINKKRPKLIEDIDKSPDFNKTSSLGFDRRSVICAPLTDKRQVIGTITIANPADGSYFGQPDLELLSTIAAQASVAIRNAHLYDEQEATYLNTMRALVSAVEASDAYTRGHSDRVSRYSVALAQKLGMDGDSLKQLEQAAVLHDIGKIGIDVALLHKKEKLTASDIEVLKMHPSIGVKILEPIHFLGKVREIIEQHHERYDGQGYPNGLGSEEWLIEAKILAVCDTYDAMTSDRPYRKALSREVAIREIVDQSGSQFDPEVAGAFVAMCNTGQLPG